MGRVKFLQAGAFNMKGGGVAPSPLHPFLALMQEKDAKRKSRHQGCLPNFPALEGVIRDAGQFGRVPDFFVVHLSFSVVSGRGVLNTPHKTTRQGRSDLSMGRCIYPCRIHVGRILLRPTLPAEKKPGAQLDSSYASPTLSLLDLRFLSRMVTLRADGCRDCHCRRHLLSVS